MTVWSNKPNIDQLKSAIESLSATPSEPKSYVDWNKIPNGYDWVAMDKNGRARYYFEKPVLGDDVWRAVFNPAVRWGTNGWVDAGYIVSTSPSWDKSLIHRPGAKE